MTQSNTAMAQSNAVDSKKPQQPQQRALLEQLRNVSGGWGPARRPVFSFYTDPWKAPGMQ